MYEALFSVLKRLNPEFTHHLGMLVVRLAGTPLGALLLRPEKTLSPAMRVETLGSTFESPLGLAAGFDKNAVGIRGFHALGFGHVEVGTVTPKAQPGNPRPRLFRLPEDTALINRMGFNNDGVDAVARRLKALRARGVPLPIIGVNIGKNKTTAQENAPDDYVACTTALAQYADYLVVNVSSPNTPGLRGLQERSLLEPILRAVRDHSEDTPVLVKIAPDLSDDAIAEVVDVVCDLGLAGIVATNTTISRESLATPVDVVARMGEGGLSGAPLAARSVDVLRIVRHTLPREYCVISVGGVMSGDDAQRLLDNGATLIQAYTGFVYRGPFFARKV
ncbi:MAG: quinone-dependent dihydroorotate dehydrogenase, partial [Pontimonas sp.]|nr:quinone-dependent dihydroorotate dehydrogenase [Pontimonas sp.]